jgi:pimeloyl-ACP methyl ester carboxylesterase
MGRQLAELSDIRRCIAIELLAQGDTEIAPNQDFSVTANAAMLKDVLDALAIDQVDLIGNDSGGGIAQIFAALNPTRVRTLTLTDCDTHDNWPMEPFKPFPQMAAAGALADTLNAMLADKAIYRSPGAFRPAYEHLETVSDADIETYLRCLVRTAQDSRPPAVPGHLRADEEGRHGPTRRPRARQPRGGRRPRADAGPARSGRGRRRRSALGAGP